MKSERAHLDKDIHRNLIWLFLLILSLYSYRSLVQLDIYLSLPHVCVTWIKLRRYEDRQRVINTRHKAWTNKVVGLIKLGCRFWANSDLEGTSKVEWFFFFFIRTSYYLVSVLVFVAWQGVLSCWGGGDHCHRGCHVGVYFVCKNVWVYTL